MATKNGWTLLCQDTTKHQWTSACLLRQSSYNFTGCQCWVINGFAQVFIKVDSSWTASLPLIWVGLCNEMAGMILQTYCCIHLTGLFTMPHAVMQMCFPMWRVRWYLIEAPHMHRCCWTWLRMTSLWDDAELLISLLLKHLLWTAVAWWWPVFIKTLENYTRDTCIILTKGLMLSHLIWNQNTACVFEQGFDSCTDTLPDPPA